MSQFLESIRIENKRIPLLEYHNHRFNKTRKDVFQIRLPINLADRINLEACQDELIKCRIVYDRTISVVEYMAYETPSVQSLKVVDGSTLVYDKKYKDRRNITQLFNKRGKADDVLITQHGWITDSSFCNLALYDGNLWHTPDRPLLKGTRRQYLLDQHKITASAIHVSQIMQFSKVRLFNALNAFGAIEIPTDDIIW